MKQFSDNQLHIQDVVLAPSQGSFFYDDQLAIREGRESDGFLYVGEPSTPGFTSIRVPAGAVSVGLVLSDHHVVWGDMVSVQYSGAGGRDPLFDTNRVIRQTQDALIPRLLGKPVTSFKSLCKEVLSTGFDTRLPLAIEYGVSQAVLRAVAYKNRQTMARTICSEFDLPLAHKRIPLYAQSGDNREINVDKMILKSVDILPHGLINSREKFGEKGRTFREFARWVKKRIQTIGAPDYHPRLHFDVYGWVGFEFENDPIQIADFIARVAEELRPFPLNIECPADFGEFQSQIEGSARIVDELDRLGSTAQIVADEYCNTLEEIKAFVDASAAHIVQVKMPDVGSLVDSIEAVLYAKRHNMGAYVGGTCAETDQSAIASTHVAFATQADMLLAKPGMGVDEGLSIVGNEQNRLIALSQVKSVTSGIFN
ncbi:MAG: methylaspartate ammonia-lyase [Sneathiellales bacterium]|nr:methylaspartate ammonia-lyase [Sneathiellales bacterium]